MGPNEGRVRGRTARADAARPPGHGACDDSPARIAALAAGLAADGLALMLFLRGLAWALPPSARAAWKAWAALAQGGPVLARLSAEPGLAACLGRGAIGAIGLAACAVALVSAAEGTAAVARRAARLAGLPRRDPPG